MTSLVESPFNMKQSSEITSNHTIHQKYCVWYHLPLEKDYSIESYRQIMNIETVEELISFTETCSDVIIRLGMLFFMKENILPMYEDPQNINGGRLSLKIPNKLIPIIWRVICYLFAGNQLGKKEQFNNTISGLTISPKKNFSIIKIWMKTCEFQNPEEFNFVSIQHLCDLTCFFTKHY